MIKQGNAVTALLNGEVDYLVHCVNCQRTMGSGIALEIKNRVPMAYAVYMDSPQVLGTFCEGGNVINLFAQEYYGTYGPFYAATGRQLHYEALATGLSKVATELGQDKTYAFPYKFGSDRAGGDWKLVKKIVEDMVHNVVWYKKDV
jgi:hypothetical protein